MIPFFQALRSIRTSHHLSSGPRGTGTNGATLGQCLMAAALLFGAPATFAQTFAQLPITAQQRSTAEQVALAGVPLGELAPNAPERHTIQRGDTLWAISGLFLQHPWRWPELWGMNIAQVRNPHLIFPGQVLVLHRVGERAFLALEQAAEGIPTVKLSPRIRVESLADAAIPPIPLHVIEPFLTDSLVINAAAHARAARIVATQEGRTLLSRGSRAYARGQYGSAEALDGQALTLEASRAPHYLVYREALALVDPATGETLGHLAQFIGKAHLLRSETLRTPEGNEAGTAQVEPATIDIIEARKEIRVGDRLVPEPQRQIPVYVPRAPSSPQAGQIVKAYGSAQRFSGQNQVVIINRGQQHGLEPGHVLAIFNNTEAVTDNTDAARPPIQLPGERNGLMMVFRTFDRVSFALVVHITDAVQEGDRFTQP